VSFPAALCYCSRKGSQQHSAGCALSYDPNNIFARILRGELPCRKVYEDEHVLAFHDIRPQAPTHIVLIPKGQYISVDDFSEKASDAELAAFIRAISHIARQEGVSEGGYRILANHGAAAHQEVPHFHLHLFGGRDLGPMLRRPESP
jgi:histidine triad (HIT) family protein